MELFLIIWGCIGLMVVAAFIMGIVPALRQEIKQNGLFHTMGQNISGE